jgi:hypothetical protein
MPAGVLPDEGITAQLDTILRRTVSGLSNWWLILFVNDYTPDDTTTLADLTEATFGGYTRVELTRPDWSAAVIDHPGCAKSVWGTDAIVWLVTSGPTETIYGFAYVDFTTNKVQLAQRFDPGDIAPVVVGGRVAMVPAYTLTSAEC